MQNFNFNAEMRVVIMQITDNRLTILTLDYYTFGLPQNFQNTEIMFQ